MGAMKELFFTALEERTKYLLKEKGLEELLKQHELYRRTLGEKGECLILHFADFKGIDLSNLNFIGAFLYDCDFRYANLTNTKFCGAHLEHSNFHKAHFHYTDFTCACIYEANFEDTETNPKFVNFDGVYTAEHYNLLDNEAAWKLAKEWYEVTIAKLEERERAGKENCNRSCDRKE